MELATLWSDYDAILQERPAHLFMTAAKHRQKLHRRGLAPPTRMAQRPRSGRTPAATAGRANDSIRSKRSNSRTSRMRNTAPASRRRGVRDVAGHATVADRFRRTWRQVHLPGVHVSDTRPPALCALYTSPLVGEPPHEEASEKAAPAHHPPAVTVTRDRPRVERKTIVHSPAEHRARAEPSRERPSAIRVEPGPGWEAWLRQRDAAHDETRSRMQNALQSVISAGRMWLSMTQARTQLEESSDDAQLEVSTEELSSLGEKQQVKEAPASLSDEAILDLVMDSLSRRRESETSVAVPRRRREPMTSSQLVWPAQDSLADAMTWAVEHALGGSLRSHASRLAQLEAGQQHAHRLAEDSARATAVVAEAQERLENAVAEVSSATTATNNGVASLQRAVAQLLLQKEKKEETVAESGPAITVVSHHNEHHYHYNDPQRVVEPSPGSTSTTSESQPSTASVARASTDSSSGRWDDPARAAAALTEQWMCAVTEQRLAPEDGVGGVPSSSASTTTTTTTATSSLSSDGFWGGLVPPSSGGARLPASSWQSFLSEGEIRVSGPGGRLARDELWPVHRASRDEGAASSGTAAIGAENARESDSDAWSEGEVLHVGVDAMRIMEPQPAMAAVPDGAIRE